MKTVSIGSRLSYDDRERFHVQHHAITTFRKGGTPLWLFDMDKLRLVLCQCVWDWIFAGGAGECPLLLKNSLTELQRAADVQFARSAATQHTKEVRALKRGVERSGGIVPLLVKILWMYRLGENSCAIAAATGLSPWGVRQRLWRMRRIASKLGFSDSTEPSTKPQLTWQSRIQ